MSISVEKHLFFQFSSANKKERDVPVIKRVVCFNLIIMKKTAQKKRLPNRKAFAGKIKW